MRALIRVTLFGRFSVTRGDDPLLDHAPRKVQELMAYLILGRNRALERASLGELLWGECDASNARKYLRQALWQLQKQLRPEAGEHELIEHGAEWIRLHMREGLMWADSVVFETTYRSLPARGETVADVKRLTSAVALHRAELLEGWYRPWCLAARDRFREMYLEMLMRLISYYESRQDFESAIGYASRALQFDPVNERMHCILMRLHFRSGDRTAALRQFEQCRYALREELEIEPGPETMALYRQIRGERAP